MYWQKDDVGAKEDSDKIKNLMADEFGFVVKQVRIPLKKPSERVQGAVLDFISRHDEDNDDASPSLLIFHYAGHGVKREKMAFILADIRIARSLSHSCKYENA
jgi:hypothetical protein